MTRIIAGTARGRRLAVPPAGTRPTTDHVRESLFSALEHRLGGFTGAAVLDLYAGSGAVGLEAASRGATRVVLVEHDPRAAAVLRDNVATVGFGAHPGSGVAQVLARTVEAVLAAGPPAQELGQPAAYDLVFVDPPYSLPGKELSLVLAQLLTAGWLADDAWLVLERSSRHRSRDRHHFRNHDVGLPPGTALVTSKTYGETTLHYAQVERPADDQDIADLEFAR